jgi:glycosyltransferase involved in cell wall biosynthesis
MKRLPKVSIVINNYNYGRFLADAIDSALTQTHPNLEVIVVDDGSTDNSREIIARYGDRIRPVVKLNGGQASALNAGFAVSSGDIIFFLDSDDMLLPEAAETVVGHWGEGVVRSFFPLNVIDADGKPLGRLIGGWAVPHATLGPFGVNSPTTGNAFSREVLANIIPVPEAHWRICADSYLSHASSLFGEANSIGKILGKYRVHGKNNIEGARSGLGEVRRGVYFNLSLHHELRRLMPAKIGPFEEWIGRYPQHWLSRITSLRESPNDHPWPDTLQDLIRKAISATWMHPYWNLRRKLAYTVFLLAYAVSPRSVRGTLTSLESGARATLPKLLMGRVPVKLHRAN